MIKYTKGQRIIISKLNTTGKYFCKDVKVAYLEESGLPLF